MGSQDKYAINPENPASSAGDTDGLEISKPGIANAPGKLEQGREFFRIPRSWRWQKGFHDYKLRTPESESRKWEYICMNPVRYGLVQRPEQWPYGGEIFYDEAGGPRLVRGAPPLLETALLMVDSRTPGQGTRPAT